MGDVYPGINTEVIRNVIQGEIRPDIESRVDPGNTGDETKLHQEAGCLIILAPIRWEPKFGSKMPTQAFVESAVVGCAFFGTSEKNKRNRMVALCKAHLSLYTSLDSAALHQKPWLYLNQWVRWGGSYVEHTGGQTGLIVAYSGGTPAQDYDVSASAARSIEAHCLSEFDRTIRKDRSISYIGGLTPPDLPIDYLGQFAS